MLAEIFGLDGAVVAVIAVAVLFGAKRLPELARSVGRAQGEVSRIRRSQRHLSGEAETSRVKRSQTHRSCPREESNLRHTV